MKKIKKEELSTLQKIVRAINQAQLAVGTLELQKQNAVADAQGLIGQLRIEKQKLEKQYGDKEINISTGELTNATN